MEKVKNLFTSESVSEGHPDKVADQIADHILDEYLKQDENAFVACEVFVSDNFVVVGGEFKAKDTVKVNIEQIVKDTLKDIGYDKDELGTNYHNVKVINKIKTQSPDINIGVNQEKDEDKGAGDQGMMFGYACLDTKEYMPLPISIAHELMRKANELRHKGAFLYARPDMKSQVTIDYSDKNNIKVNTILMSVQHDEDVNYPQFKKYIYENIMIPVVKSFNLNLDFKYYINPTGSFVIGGPSGDTGVTGRKIIVDTYGGTCAHGGGAFSGKDPSKVDRSGSYMARYIAKNLVAAGVAERLEVQISYAIGINKPISIGLKTYHTSKYNDLKILEIIEKVFDMRPGMIAKNFSMRKPSFSYHKITNYGHFGKKDVPWEKLDKVDEIKKLLQDK